MNGLLLELFTCRSHVRAASHRVVCFDALDAAFTRPALAAARSFEFVKALCGIKACTNERKLTLVAWSHGTWLAVPGGGARARPPNTAAGR